MAGFGEQEQEHGSTPSVDIPNDEIFKENLSKDLVIAMDRDMNGYINFNEYLLIRKSVIAWM